LYTQDDIQRNDSWDWDTGKEKESLEWLLKWGNYGRYNIIWKTTKII
jgi:hypothetical protein